MLRRRAISPVIAAPVQWTSGLMRHQVHNTGSLGKISYTPPGNSVPHLPWFRGAQTTKPAASTPVPPSMLNVKPSIPPLSMPSSTELDGILSITMMEEEASRVGAGARIMPENVGVLQSTAAQCGPMRATATRRMPVLTGPTLDTRIGDIIKADESLAAEMLPDIVRLLIDPNAEGVENVSLTDFASMQPKRQLAALNGKRSWLEWLLESSHYKQVSRLSLESPHYDLRALRLAGITTLYQWAEQPNLVKVSSCTRSLLDAAVDKSVETYVDEVVKLVNTSNMLEDTLVLWAADIIGKFILDSLNIPANHAMLQSGGIGFDSASTGHICTLEHYHRLVKKVIASVRREYMMQRHMGAQDNEAMKASLDPQAEAEIREKAYATLSDAMLRVLETQAPNMPKELHPLRDYGFLALERLPGLLRQTASALQLQSIPVRYFVFHNTGEWGFSPSTAMSTQMFTHSDSTRFSGAHPGGNSMIVSGNAPSALDVAAPTLAGGVFLTGSTNYNVTLGEWCGSPQPSSSPELWQGNPVQNEYFSVLHRLKRHTIRVARTTLFDAIKGADRLGKGFSAAEALGLQQLFGAGKLVEERLLSVLSGYYMSSSASKQLHFVEAGHSCGKTSVLERLSKRMAESGRTAITVRYSGSTTPFAPGLDDHPLAFAPRFWFRVALASCPYLVRTEEIFTRAPQSVMWWANRNNWSWELYQKRIRIRGHCEGAPPPLHAILVDDIDRVLDCMEHHIPQLTYPGGLMNSMDTNSTLQLSAGEATMGVGVPQNPQYHSPQNVEKGAASDIKAAGIPSPAPSGVGHHAQHEQQFTQDMVETALSKVTVALGQLNMVFTGHHVSKVLLVHADAPVRRYFVPLASGIGLQQRLRVLPLVSVLHALHQRFRLGFSGLMYEVLKNCPGLLGYTLDVFWSGRAALMDLRGGAPRLMQWSGTHPLLRSYVPSELFADLPQRNYLLRNPPEARMRLVELLQRQLSSPTGYLTRDVDTTLQDERDGLIVPYNHTACQVHPFALFTIFSHQDPLESPRETPIVRAWGEVWAEYCAVVSPMGTTSVRKRDALRVLLHGALLLRAVAVSGVQIDLNLKIPPYGFPLLASPTRSKQRGSAIPTIMKATPETVRKAGSAYRAFFANTLLERFPFRPSVGLNGGCDVVFVDGTTLALYDLVTTTEALRNISYRFAEALLGVLHCIEKNILPQHRIQTIHYVSVVSVDQASSTNSGMGGVSNGGEGANSRVSVLTTDEMFTATPVPIVPYFLDLSAVFEDSVIDRLRVLQEILGIDKEFRTLNDILDELESVYHVHVHQDVVASQAELESLLSSTLMQLVPDATVLPPYRAEVLPPNALMVDILDDEHEGSRRPEMERVESGAAVPHDAPTGDDFVGGDPIQDSAELLEAMMNDAFSSSAQEYPATPAQDPSATTASMESVAVGNPISSSIPAVENTPHPTATVSQEDALAWLHDIVTPAAASSQESDRSSATAPTAAYPSASTSRPAVITAPLPFNRKSNSSVTHSAMGNRATSTAREPAAELKKVQEEVKRGKVSGQKIEVVEVEEVEVEEQSDVEQATRDNKGRGRSRGRVSGSGSGSGTDGKGSSTKAVTGKRGRKPLQRSNVPEKKPKQQQANLKRTVQSVTPKRSSSSSSTTAASSRGRNKSRELAKPAKRTTSRASVAAASKTDKNAKKKQKKSALRMV
ncbi:hypothetical protein, conserved [Trypanosoma brucei gambiense DAL972]|uniref:Uncharacterized protein n=1 Tax=Trypanosoma brucei gambiense (strain MHOM/CI/86/DAL972) TaxID=679716 RepID=C9ZVL8_TRYB9|nr:hypothetical protein, conserved [Trypanosoma brucei gambiense DAL972]CBH13456.1 hypothetical protein, conserved [Trypanosoma brucei gambiense DAL972]|eukprot:XP_011775733.1 hypothetical protein, conserved [Trypanosoma brucei gambiense DAL972]